MPGNLHTIYVIEQSQNLFSKHLLSKAYYNSFLADKLFDATSVTLFVYIHSL